MWKKDKKCKNVELAARYLVYGFTEEGHNVYNFGVEGESYNWVDKDGEKVGNKERKKFKINKNIDTYRDENTPDLKTRFTNFKQTIADAFASVNPKEDIKRPIYRF